MSSTNSRISKANQILDRAEKMLLGGMSKQQALDIMSKCWNGISFALGNIDNPLGNAMEKEREIVKAINKANRGIKALPLGNGVIGLATGVGNAMINDLNGEDTVEKVIDMGTNVALSLFSFTPAGAFVNLANFAAGELLGYDASTLLKDIYKNLIGENVDLKNTRITPDGFLETVVDGVVYARPFMPNAQGSLFGNGKDDVLFGGNGKDIFIGHGGNDIFVGNGGKDDYFVSYGDTIIDSDGKGRVFLGSSHQLKGGTQIEFQKQDEKLKYEKQIKDISVFLENEKDMRENLSELYADTTKAKNYIARLNESGEKSKIELLNSLIKTIQKKQDLTEHILEAKFMLIKANLMAGQDKVCK